MKKLLLAATLFIIINLALYVFVKSYAYIGSWMLFGTLILLFVFAFVILFITGLIFGFSGLFSKHTIGLSVLKPAVKWSLVFMIMLVAQVLISDLYTYVPQTSPIAYQEAVSINETKQYITVRGTDEDNPIILFLAGGPGGSQVQATRMKLKGLEDEFTIVTWEQPGSGMSYHARDIEDLTPELYIDDAHALTAYLKDKFNQEKIYLLGESWGSYLAVKLASAYPENYHAIVTTGQMVAFAETEVYCYNKAYEIAVESNDQQQIKALEKLGDVPLREGNIALESATYLMYLHQYMNSKDEVYKTDYDTFDDLFSPEYDILDSINYMRALLNTFSHVYKQLYDEDLRETNTHLDVPIYILQGEHDVNAPNYLVEDYYERLDAPDKALIWFEHSGHSAWITEHDRFAQTVKDLLLE